MSSVEQTPVQEERLRHTYTSSVIPWYVRLIWAAFWVFVVWYGVKYMLPAMQTELIAPP